MKRTSVIAAALLLIATGGLALSSELVDWFNGPAQFLMTKEEIATWKTLTTDEQAKAFVELFWARRDPTPDTARNEARDEFEARVAYADKNFAAGRKRGALTDRGKALIVYGTPKRLERAPERRGFSSPDQRTDDWVQWVYEGDDAQKTFNNQRVVIRFVDVSGGGDYRMERGSVDLGAAHTRAIQRLLVRPELTSVPVPAAARPAAPAVPAAPANVTTLTTPALAAAVTELKAATRNPYENLAYVTWGEFITGQGTYFVPVMLYLPKSAGLAADEEVTFFGLVEDESGTPLLAFEEKAKLHMAKEDVFLDKSLSLPAGKHRVFLGVARDGKPLAIASANMTLAGSLDKDAPAASALILSNFVQPMAEAQKPTEPFAFGGVKIVPKGDKTFTASDELWYFFELRNPGLAEAIAPTEGTATGAPAEQRPKIQVKVDVEGKDADGKTVKRSAPPAVIEAVQMKGVPGHYGVGNAIPLASFKPGEYTMTIKAIDTVRKTSYTLSDTFKVK